MEARSLIRESEGVDNPPERCPCLVSPTTQREDSLK